MKFTVVIPTFNRKSLLPRAIQSVCATQWPEVEIIVVDDASTDGTSNRIGEEFPGIRYFRMERNSGPGTARDRGIREATGDWAVLLDDDDILRADSLATIARCVGEFSAAASYPCLQFARTNGSLCEPFRVASLADYLTGRIAGDFVPVINVDMFRRKNLRYPDVRIGGEHLLWYEIAKTHGIPSWNVCVCNLGTGDRVKLCSAASQVARAHEYARLADLSLEQFGDDMLALSPRRYVKCAIGSAAYHLLAGDRVMAATNARRLTAGVRLLTLAFLAVASPWPPEWLRLWFRAYRRMSGSCES